MSNTSDIVNVGERIADHFPLGTGNFNLEVVTGQEVGRWHDPGQPTALAVLRLIVWDVDPDTGARSIRDIKEQEVAMGWPKLYDNRERVAAFFAALGALIDEIAAGKPNIVDKIMPSDLICADALKLQSANTQADFEAALRTKGRLGQFL